MANTAPQKQYGSGRMGFGEVARKVAVNMREMKKGKLHSGSKKGPLVKSRAQALAISYNQASKGE